MAEKIPPGFLTAAEAGKLFKRTKRTLLRQVKDGKVRGEWIEREDGNREVVYSQADLKKLKAERDRRTAARPPNQVEGQMERRLVRNHPLRLLEELAERDRRVFLTMLQAQGQVPRLTEKVWLSLDEAVEYSGLAKSDLVKLCQRSWEWKESYPPPPLTVRKSGGWKILRRTLEAFEG